ncbi:MAG: riboflavin biosynthesis protein RibF [Bacteroidaceae bacterium]|nr:riboflavin biosynthesis protein RibF [Bacteroidaceae bacterium]
MEIFTDIDSLGCVPSAVTVGSFDGVHRGHVAMIAEARALAQERGLPLTVVTFARHPRLLFSGSEQPFLLTSADDKLSLLERAGADRCLLLPFDHAMASLTAKEFMRDILQRCLGVSMLAVGYDHRFGRPQRDEGIEQYIDYGREIGVEVIRMHPYAPDGQKISSSRVRGELAAGDVEAAARMLGRNYSLQGCVVHGEALGRRLGFPTANISLKEPLQLLPLDGVYECVISVRLNSYRGVMNVGCKPTVNGSCRTIEVFIIGFDGDIYGEPVVVEFVRRLRGERRFAGLDDLRAQIESDVRCVREGTSY